MLQASEDLPGAGGSSKAAHSHGWQVGGGRTGVKPQILPVEASP